MLPHLLLVYAVCAPPDTTVTVWEARLGATSFQERERASRALRQNGNDRLYRRLMASRDPEVRQRAQHVYEDWRSQVLNSLHPYPGLDAFWFDLDKGHYVYDSYFYYRYHHYLDRATAIYPCPGAYRWATYHWAQHQLDNGMPVWCLRLIFVELRRRDCRAGYGPHSSFWGSDHSP